MSSDSDHRRSRSSERKQSEKRERRDKRSSASAAAALADVVRRPTVGPRQAQGNRLWCHVYLDKRHPEFDLVTELIGESGCHLREIYQATYAKLRVRGRGSGHLEVDGATEAPVPLMVAVTSEGVDQARFRTAVEMTISKLRVVQGLFVQFCQQRTLSESLASENLWRFGEMSKDAEIVLADLLPEGGKPQLARRAPMPAVVSQDSAVAEGQMAQDAAAAYPVEKPPWLTLALDSVGSDVERRLSTRLDSISSDLREVKSDQTVIKQEVQRQGVSLQGLQLRQDQADSGDVPQVTSGKPLKTIAFLIKTPIELR